MRTYRAHFFGKDDKKLHLMIWEPDVKPVAVLQIVHGMTEYIERYKDLAERLTEKGIIVCGFSLRGHGESYNSSKNPKVASIGEDGWEKSIEVIKIFNMYIQDRYDNLPYYMLGFSLGSFLLREYLSRYSDNLAGAIIVGTGNQSASVIKPLRLLVKMDMSHYGIDGHTALVNKLSFETYNNKFKPTLTEFDWLCSDREQLESYIGDNLCRKQISSGLFYELLGSMLRTSCSDACSSWNKNMPVLVMSGLSDPVGNFGKGVEAFIKQLEENNINFSSHLFSNARHDLLHEKASGDANLAITKIEELILN